MFKTKRIIRKSFSSFYTCLLLESEVITAQALYDFNARSSREVDFRKGDSISLFKQVSGDWWRGSVNGKEGLIPDKYIMLTMRYIFVRLLFLCMLFAFKVLK